MKLFRNGLALLLALFCATSVWASETPQTSEYTLSQLTQEFNSLEKQEITLVGTVISTCKSGCKLWLANGTYHEGDPYILVRAKDDAFKFDTKADGTVALKGFAVGQWIDGCADKAKTGEEAKEEHAADGKTCAGPAVTQTAAAEGTKTLGEITFFATGVEYRK